ncbi:lipopolysaccharide transport periplasmic protein LptA [Bowmanella pacifica]|uniref:Lipopolysaccharide export system protein LptA n=1 Tax=Bowmanella pacifica TaxID=502051 RepID=A0A918DKD2_9ALTE|nr:lipopolysaccharide transport periplasmic protein LptA [Bowmanella pacifica]GGO68985.1 hypothetical protein GCM10010982_19200 [Bowmanella pacifica]
MAKTTKFNLLLAALLLSASANAINQDFNEPIRVASKFQSGDGINKVSIFREDVKITQGSLSIEASEVEVNAEQGKGREIFIARGNPAEYQQTMADGSRIRALANHIEYQVEKRTLTLSGNAELHQNSSSVSGDKIEFNMEKEQLVAQGSDDGDGRVETIFQPEPKKKPVQEK